MDADFKRQIAQGVPMPVDEALLAKVNARGRAQRHVLEVKRAELRGQLKALRKIRNTLIDQIEEFGRKKELADMDGDTPRYVTLNMQQETLIDMKAEVEYHYQQVCNQAAEEVS